MKAEVPGKVGTILPTDTMEQREPGCCPQRAGKAKLRNNGNQNRFFLI
jgi:hypothetical protein